MKKNRIPGLLRGFAAILIAWIIASTGLVAIAFAHDDVRGRPHFKGPPAAPTAVMGPWRPTACRPSRWRRSAM